MTNLRRQRISNWVMLGLTVAAATVSAIAITQFRQQADQYRQTELMLTRIEGQMHLLEGLEVRWEADRKNADLRRELEETRTNLRQYFRALGESRTDVSLQELSSAGDAYVNFFSEGPASPSSTDRQYASSNLSGRVRQSSATYNEQAQTAIWKSDLEATLGLLAFVVAIAAILWRFGAVRRNADLAKAEQRTLQQSEERFRTLTDKSSDVIAIVDAEGAIFYLSNSIEHVLGYPRQQWDGHTVLELVHPEEAPVFAEMLHRISRTSDSRNTAEFRFRHADSVWRHMEVTARNDLSTQNVGGIVVNARDITERKIAEEQLLHDAFHDPLTSLPNRTLLLDRLQRAVNRSRRQENYKFGLLFIDLDRFKIVNDSLGHQAGDQLIVEVASRLGNSLRQTMPQGRMRPTGDDTIARIGGDEFTVLIEEIRDPADAIRVAERILARLELPFVVNGIEMFTSASIGIAISSAPYTSADEVLRDADIAMYRAKAAGGARMEVFDGEMHSQAVHRLTLETDLRKALERQEFEVYYQPIVTLATSRIEGVEALIRWNHPERGLLPPGEFISVAEDMGLIVAIGRWILRESCRQMAAFQKAFPSTPALTVSVNISAKEFAQPELVEQVRHVLEETGLCPGSLRLEITESVTMGDVERVTSTLARLKEVGVRISIDDFGTGYSSLSYLSKFPIDTLKIDRSFVAGLDGEGDNREIVRTITNLAHNLSLEVVAEGAETREQVDELRVMSCKYAQGYFFSKPVSADTLSRLLADRDALQLPRATSADRAAPSAQRGIGDDHALAANAN